MACGPLIRAIAVIKICHTGSFNVIRRSSGRACIPGTRVPAQTLMDYLEQGDSLSDFLADFPSVTREQAVAAIELAKQFLIRDASAA
jgi:uncharacterized protein (DUF433 family)